MSSSGNSRYRKQQWDCGSLDGLDPRNELRSWLEKNGFMHYGSSKGRDYTCTFLNGGTALIPDDQYETFLLLMANEIDIGRSWSVHENATRFAPLFFDFDISERIDRCDATQEIDVRLIHDWIAVVQSAALDFFPGARAKKRNSDKLDEKTGRVVVLQAPVAYEVTKRPASAGRSRSASSAGAAGGATLAQTVREAERVALAQRVGSGSAPSQAQVLAHIRSERDAASAGESTVRKTGLHLVFPYVVCDLNQMLQVRAHVVTQLAAQFDAPGDDSWDKIVDVQVYTGSGGIRLPGTLKVKTCDSCRGDMRRRQACDACNGRPRTFVDRPYKPLLVLGTSGRRKNGVLGKLQSDTEHMLLTCSIRRVRAYETKPPFVRPAQAAPYSGPSVRYAVETPSPQNTSWTNAKRLRQMSSGGRGAASSSNGRSKASSAAAASSGGAATDVRGSRVINVFGPEHEVSKMLEEFIRRHTYAQWRGVVVSEVRQVLLPANSRFRSPGTIYLINVSDSGSRHCLNYSGEHRSRSIYFVAKHAGVDQRCFCRCTTVDGRVSGVPCSEFRSNVCEFLQFSLGRRIQMRLFPSESGATGAATLPTNGANGGGSASALAAVDKSSVPLDALVSVERNSSVGSAAQYPSLAAVREHTNGKRRAAGLSDDSELAGGAGHNSKKSKHGASGEAQPPGDDGLQTPVARKDFVDARAAAAHKRPRTKDAYTSAVGGGSAVLFARPPDGSVSSAALERIDSERRLAQEETPDFAQIGALAHSFTPDYSAATSITALTSASASSQQFSATAAMVAAQKREQADASTFVTLPLCAPPRDIAHYKQMLKQVERTIGRRTREQVDRYLQS